MEEQNLRQNSVFAAALSMMLLFGFGLSRNAEAGSAPVADNLELSTPRNIPVEGRLTARDADDDIVSFEITTDPVKGDIVLQDEGIILYTPHRDKKGRDYFGYRAKDAEGNVSQEATAIIRIEK